MTHSRSNSGRRGEGGVVELQSAYERDESIVLKMPLGVGTMQWGTTQIDKWLNPGILPDATVAEIMGFAMRKEVTFFDTAEGYGGGSSEERLRDTVASHGALAEEAARVGLMVATKFLPTAWRFTERQFFGSLRGSLERLGVSQIKLYFIHTPVHFMPLEFWVRCCCRAARMGLIRAIGLSNCNAEQVERAVAEAERYGARIAANQVMVNLLDFNSAELQRVLHVCQKHNIRVIGFSPIGQGLLTNKLTAERFEHARMRRMTGVTWSQLQPLRDALDDIAQKHGQTMVRVCLNWSYFGHGIIPLVGCRSMKQARDSFGYTDFRLDADDVRRLDDCAMNHSTLEKPSWHRGFFVMLISFLQVVYLMERVLGRLWR